MNDYNATPYTILDGPDLDPTRVTVYPSGRTHCDEGHALKGVDGRAIPMPDDNNYAMCSRCVDALDPDDDV